MFLKAILAGIVNATIFAVVMNPLMEVKDEVFKNTYTLNMFVGWLFFTAVIWQRADEEWKKVDDATRRHDKEAFMVESSKMIAPSFWIFYVVVSIQAIILGQLFHVENGFVAALGQFAVGFVVAFALIILKDLDDPTSGVINVPNIPEEWLDEIHKKGDRYGR
jgi:uncharacterized membrane protein YdcZ (DUF606 family)